MDSPKPIKIRYTCRMGGEVYRLHPNRRPTGRPIKEALRMGERLSVPTLLGRCEAVVSRLDGTDHAQAISGGTLCFLSFGQDDRGCWTCAASGPKDLKIAVQVVD